MTTTVNVQEMVWRLDPQFRKKDAGHIGIGMLTGVHQHLCQVGRLRDGMRYHAGLDKLRTCAQNCDDFFSFYYRSILHTISDIKIGKSRSE